MLHGKTRVAVQWLSDHSRGNVLSSDSFIESRDFNGVVTHIIVLDALQKKHTDSTSPTPSTLLPCTSLPPMLNLEVTGAHVHYGAGQIQGSAGPSGTDANHWQDVLFRVCCPQ